jgi:CRISPR system Cascade subunit CasA
MKARCWYETTFPLYLVPGKIREDFTARVLALTESADIAAKSVQTCIKEAWFKRPGDARGDTSFLTQAFYQHTEQFFYQAVQQLIQKLPEDSDVEVLREWHGRLRRSGLKLFDYWAEQGDISETDPRRIAMAREKLFKGFKNKKMRELLHVPVKKGRNT